MRQSFQTLSEAAASEAAALQQAEEDYDRISDSRNDKEIEVHEAEKLLKSLQQDVDALETRFTALHRERTQMEADRAKMQTQLQVLEQAENL